MRRGILLRPLTAALLWAPAAVVPAETADRELLRLARRVDKQVARQRDAAAEGLLQQLLTVAASEPGDVFVYGDEERQKHARTLETAFGFAERLGSKPDFGGDRGALFNLLGVFQQNLGSCPLGRADACAEPLFRQALEADRGSARSAYNLARLLVAQGKFDEAGAVLRAQRAPADAALQLAIEQLRCFAEAGPTDVAVAGPGRPHRGPRRVYAPKPELTDAAVEAKLAGVVVVEALLGTDGGVECLHVIKGMPLGVTGAVLESLREWRYAPFTIGGQPAPVRLELTTSFGKVQRGWARVGG